MPPDIVLKLFTVTVRSCPVYLLDLLALICPGKIQQDRSLRCPSLSVLSSVRLALRFTVHTPAAPEITRFRTDSDSADVSRRGDCDVSAWQAESENGPV